jgi:hypothetical protein
MGVKNGNKGIEMTKQEYEELAFAQIIRDRDIAWQDIDGIKETIRQCFDRGFSLFDCVDYNKLTEEVSPHLDEDYALKRMSEISSKYNTDTATKSD